MIRTARLLIVSALLLTAACKGKETKSKAEAPKPTEKTGTEMALAEAATLAPKDDADFKAKTDALNKKALAILAAGEIDCDKVTKQLAELRSSTRTESDMLFKYEESHPSVRESDKDMEARQKEFEIKGAKTLEACKDHQGFIAELATPSGSKFD